MLCALEVEGAGAFGGFVEADGCGEAFPEVGVADQGHYGFLEVVVGVRLKVGSSLSDGVDVVNNGLSARLKDGSSRSQALIEQESRSECSDRK